MSFGFQGLWFLAYRALGTPKSKDRNAMASGTKYHCVNDFFLPKNPYIRVRGPLRHIHHACFLE